MKIYGESWRSIEGSTIWVRWWEHIKWSEAEVLFPMWTEFKVMSIDYTGKIPVVELKEIMPKSTVNHEIVKANANLSPTERIIKAKELLELKNLTPTQEQAILAAHKLPGELFNLNFWETRAKMEKLLEANFTSEQIRVLMDNGICGEISEKGWSRILV